MDILFVVDIPATWMLRIGEGQRSPEFMRPPSLGPGARDVPVTDWGCVSPSPRVSALEASQEIRPRGGGMGQGIKDDGLRKLHRTLNAAATPAMSREHCNWTYLSANGQLRE